MNRLVSLGELLVDFTPAGMSAGGNPLFERNAGGGPANLACAAARLGADVAFVGKVGDDVFGRALRDVLADNGVDTAGLVLSRKYKTTLAFVHLDERGDRSFSFYRRNGADTMLLPEDLPRDLLRAARVFFFSSVMMSEGPSRETGFLAAEEAKKAGATVAFDPNFRFNLWESKAAAKECALRALTLADMVKISEEELLFLTGEKDVETGSRRLAGEYALKVVLATLGPRGCVATAFSAGGVPCAQASIGGFPAATIDTTGAGDAFTGGFLARLLARGGDLSIYAADPAALLSDARFANAVGSLTTTRRGGIPALPTEEETESYLREVAAIS